MKTSVCLLLLLCLPLGALAQNVPVASTPDEYRVVPGERLGRVFLGATRAVVHRRLGAPNRSYRLPGGLDSELWAGDYRVGIGDYHRFEVLYRRGRVVQIEATDPLYKAKGLRLDTDLEAWRDRYGRAKISGFTYPRRANRRQEYHDWKRAGLALEYVYVAANRKWRPDTLIVHPKRGAVVPDAGGVR